VDLTASNNAPASALSASIVLGGDPSTDLMVWHHKYGVGVGVMDDDHRGLFDAINAVQAAVIRKESHAAIGSRLNALAQATRAHFAAEEALMAGAQYAGLALHALKHQRLLEQVVAFVTRYERGGFTLHEHSLNFLRDWLIPHIQEMDLNFGLWLNEHGKR